MAKRAVVNRQVKILNAAEKAFAEGGYFGASMRDIVRMAGVNLATVYYYFGSKTGLMEAVLKRRFGPLRQEHLETLREFERQSKGLPLAIEKILEAMLTPPLRLISAPATRRQAVTRLLGRMVTEPDAQTHKILQGQRSEVRGAFLKAFEASLPKASVTDIEWRMEFVWGALAFILCNPKKFQVTTRGARNPANAPKLLKEMIHFFAAGFRAAADPHRPDLVL